jgi:hypothetical protein
VTVAVNVTVCDTVTAPRSGEIETLIGSGGGVEELEPQPLHVTTIRKNRKFHSIGRLDWRLNVIEFIKSFRALPVPHASKNHGERFA